MGRRLHGSVGFLGRDGDRQAGYERSRRPILMNSFTCDSYRPSLLTALMFNYSRRGKSSDFQPVKLEPWPVAARVSHSRRNQLTKSQGPKINTEQGAIQTLLHMEGGRWSGETE